VVGLALDPLAFEPTGLPILGLTGDGAYQTISYTRPIYADVSYNIEVSYDLLRARRARRSAGLDPDVEPVIDAGVVEEPTP